MTTNHILTSTALALALMGTTALAGGIVGDIVNAPLSATGTVQGARTGINVYLQSDDAKGMEFMDPGVLGYGIPAGGHMEIKMGDGFERDWDVGLSQASIMMVTGAPQQGLPGAGVGYEVMEGEDVNIFIIRPTGPDGLVAENLMSAAPGAKSDPTRQRGIKVLHIGFQQSAFINAGNVGVVHVRIIDGAGQVVSEGAGELEMIPAPVPQVLPTNFPQGARNHNWQQVSSGDIVGVTDGTVPVTLMLYDAAPGNDRDEMYAFKAPITGAGVLSTPELRMMGFSRPDSMARYNGGLIVQDTDGDGTLDPAQDLIIGGVIANAPKGAKGQELKSLRVEGQVLLSQPTDQVAAKPGKRWGGAMMQLQFTAGSLAGKYRPTLALLRDPANPEAGDGSAFTYTIVVK
ncbi:MAG: hypothetical protein L3J36_01200 [Rhodobacteraceae bacterium]|nr:hypothetical protein [Paracoccaceae bacterium]